MDPRERTPRYEGWLIAFAFLLYGFLLFDRYAVLFLLPSFVGELGLSQSAVGGIVAVQALGWGLAGGLFGALSDRVGRRAVLIPATILFSLASAATGLVRSTAEMLVARFVMTALEGAAAMPLFATVMAESGPRRRGLNLGVVTSAGTLVGFVLGPVVVTQLAASYGWRWAFALVGLPGLLLALGVWRFVREPRPAEGAAAAPPAAQPMRAILRYRNIRLALVIGTLLGFYPAAAAFMPLYLTTTGYQLATTTMGTVMAVGGLGSVVGIVGLPMLSDRVGRKPVLLAALVLLALQTWAVPLVGPDPARLAIALAVFGVGTGAFPIILTIVPTESAPIALAATATALPIFFEEVVGGALGPVLAGAGADAFSPAFPLWLGGAACLAALVPAALCRETAPRRVAGALPEPVPTPTV
jgi:MFS transporter, ACS family, hexuronate transporter